MTLSEYAKMDSEYRSLYFSLGSREQTDSIEHSNEISAVQTRADSVRKLFKPGRAQNVPGAAPGLVYTAYGSLASAGDQYQAAIESEEKAKRNSAQKEA